MWKFFIGKPCEKPHPGSKNRVKLPKNICFILFSTIYLAWPGMGHVTYIILFGLYMEYLEPSMTSSASHVIPKIEIFDLKNLLYSKYA